MSFFITVIVPNYNHARFLQKRIDSILQQTYSHFELILLDDHSTDNSKEIIEQYRSHPKVTAIYYNTYNSGSPFKQWHKGITAAKGDWVWIAESDDTAAPTFLEAAVGCLLASPQAGMYYCNAQVIDENDAVNHTAADFKNSLFCTSKWSDSYINSGVEEVNEALKFFCSINNASSLLFNKELGLSVINTVVRYRYIGDWVFYILAGLQTSIYYNSNVLSAYRGHDNNFINKKIPIEKIKSEYFELLQLLLLQPEVSGKEKLIDFFSLIYLGFGWMAENALNGWQLYRNYFKKDKKLALKVMANTFKYKFLQRKIYTGYTGNWVAEAKKVTGFT